MIRLARLAGMICLIAAGVLALGAAFAPPITQGLTGPFTHADGQAYSVLVPDVGLAPFRYLPGDQSGAPYTSSLLLLENGQPLGPAHSSHADIREKGGGRYSHWNTTLYFSASDNTDPNTNGRAYGIRAEAKLARTIPLALVLAGLSLLALSCWRGTVLLAAIGGAGLLGVNLWGLAAPADLAAQHAVRVHDSTLSYAEARQALRTARVAFHSGTLNDADFVREINRIVSARMVNPAQADVDAFHLFRIPLRENWLLRALALRPGWETYQFTDPLRTLRRGVGMCQRQALTVARLLAEDGFETVIWGTPGTHVTAVARRNGQTFALDPDYGAVFAATPYALSYEPETVRAGYRDLPSGYTLSAGEEETLLRHYRTGGSTQYLRTIEGVWADTALPLTLPPDQVESLAYCLKWAVPVGLMIPALLWGLFRRRRRAVVALVVGLCLCPVAVRAESAVNWAFPQAGDTVTLPVGAQFPKAVPDRPTFVVNPAPAEAIAPTTWRLPVPGLYFWQTDQESGLILVPSASRLVTANLVFQLVTAQTTGGGNTDAINAFYADKPQQAFNLLARREPQAWNCGPTAQAMGLILDKLGIPSRLVQWLATDPAKQHQDLEVDLDPDGGWTLYDPHYGLAFAPGVTALDVFRKTSAQENVAPLLALYTGKATWVPQPWRALERYDLAVGIYTTPNTLFVAPADGKSADALAPLGLPKNTVIKTLATLQEAYP